MLKKHLFFCLLVCFGIEHNAMELSKISDASRLLRIPSAGVDVNNPSSFDFSNNEIAEIQLAFHEDIVFEVLYKTYKTPNGYDSTSLRSLSRVNKNYFTLMRKPEFRRFLMQHRCPPILFTCRDHSRYHDINQLVHGIDTSKTLHSKGSVNLIKLLNVLYSDAQRSSYINPYECKKSNIQGGPFLSLWTSACVLCDIPLIEFFLKRGINVNARCDCKENHYMDTAFSAIIVNPYKQPEKQQFDALDLLARHDLAISDLSHELCRAIEKHDQSDETMSRKNRLLCKIIELRYAAAHVIVSDREKNNDLDILLEISFNPFSLNNNYAEIEPALIILLKNGADPRIKNESDNLSAYEYACFQGRGKQFVETVRKNALQQYILTKKRN